MPAKDNLGRNFAHTIIHSLIPPRSRVLDLGCGDGSLLASLSSNKHVIGQGVEIDENQVIACLNKGVSIVQGNIDEGLKEYPDKSYDYVILNETLQAVYNTEFVLSEMLRVGHKAIVGIPNFAHWRIRAYLTITGRLPMTRVFNSEWYNTPNIRLATIKDFRAICERLNIRILGEYFSAHNHALGFLKRLRPNLFCENALFLVEKA